MNAVARLLLAMCAGVAAGASVAGENLSESGEPPAAAVAPPQAVAQSAPAAPAGPSTMSAATPDPSSGSKADTGAQPGGIANKPGRKVLVDDTVNDAQLKQILAKGYQPESQARGNEVYYCRSDHELGSRFESKVCKTARRILQDEQQGKNATTTIQQTTGTRAGN
jgi:hypothetical protein